MFIRTRTSMAMMLLSALITRPADAQRVPDVRGFHLGAAVNATSIKLDETPFSDDERENGYGLHLGLGYNFTTNFGLTFSITGASINDSQTEDYDVAHVDIAGRVSFPGRSALVPYIELGLAGVAAEYSVQGAKVELEGAGVSAGAGLHYFFSRRAAFDVNFRITGGEFDDGEIGDREIDTGDGVGFNTTRLNIGIAFYP